MRGGDYDLAGFAVGAAERGELLPSADVAEGDVVLGLASSGVALQRLLAGAPHRRGAPVLPGTPRRRRATARRSAEALLAPTRIYVRPLLAAIRGTGAIKALAHITGGGFTENIPRVLPKGLAAEIDLSQIAVPPVFGWLARTGGVEAREMLRTFNCGVGMVVVVAAGDAADRRRRARSRRARPSSSSAG